MITELILNYHQHKMTIFQFLPQKDQLWGLPVLMFAFKSRSFGSAKLWQEGLPGVQHIRMLVSWLFSQNSRLILCCLPFHLAKAFNLFDSNLLSNQ